jgi:voltage-gated sodium channel
MKKLSVHCQQVIANRYFTRSVMFLILLNTALIGLETYPALYDTYKYWFHVIDQGVLWLFTLEIMIKLIAIRFSWRFFKDPWNVFDFVIVMLGHLINGSTFVTLLRIIRILRVFRTITVIPSLKKLTNALLLTLPSLGTIFLFTSLIFYVFAVMGTMLYREVSPEYFGSIELSLLTLFQVVTLEAWASDVMRPVMKLAPYAWVYFVSFVLLGTFVLLNLFVGVIVTNVDQANKEEQADQEKTAQQATVADQREQGSHVSSESSISHQGDVYAELAAVKQELQEIKKLLQNR